MGKVGRPPDSATATGQRRPGQEATPVSGRVCRVVGNDSAALQLDRTDAGIVVGQNGGTGAVQYLRCPWIRFGRYGRPRVPHERSQMSRLQLHHIGVNRVALRHIHGFPGAFPGHRKCGMRWDHQSGPARSRYRSVTENPASTLQHLDGLSAKLPSSGNTVS